MHLKVFKISRSNYLFNLICRFSILEPVWTQPDHLDLHWSQMYGMISGWVKLLCSEFLSSPNDQIHFSSIQKDIDRHSRTYFAIVWPWHMVLVINSSHNIVILIVGVLGRTNTWRSACYISLPFLPWQSWFQWAVRRCR